MTHFQTVIVGAGPAALAVALRMAAADRASVHPDRLRVLDPAGRWLAVWDAQMSGQRISHLRSPAVHHPDPSPFSLTRWLDQDTDLICPDGIHLPSVEAFAGFCRCEIDTAGLDRVVASARVTGLDLSADSVRLHTTVGAVDADRVVIATNPRRPCIPAWARRLDPQIAAQVVPGGDLARRADRSGQHIVVIGAGLSAAHLARGAVEDGARTTLLTRRPIVQRRMDVDPKWLGPTRMGPFAQADPVTRRQLVSDARGGGSMPAWAHRMLVRLCDGGHLDVREGMGVTDAVPVGGRVALLTGQQPVMADEVWLATGARSDVCADPALRDLVEQHPTAIHDGLPELAWDLRWGATPVHLVGATAALQVGPVAGNLFGHREAAARVVASWS